MSNYYEQLLDLQQAFAKGDTSAIAQAESLYQTSGHPDFAHLLCQMYCKHRHFSKALAFCEQVQKQHDTIRFKLMHSQILGSLGLSKQFRKSLARLGTESFVNTIELATYAKLCALAERPLLAFHAYLEVIKAEPRNIDALYSAAVMARHLGKLEYSYQLCQQVIALDENFYQAYWLISQLPSANDAYWIEAIHKLKASKLSIKGRVHCGYALGNLLERAGEPEQAFTEVSNAASLRRKHLNYNTQQDLARLTAIEKQIEHCTLAEPNPSAPSPVFIVGLPRSGTTLLERILTMTDEISSVGESNELPKWMMKLLQAQMPSTNSLSAIEYAHQYAINNLGDSYFEHVGHRTPIFIDKLPMNSLNIGVILRNIPNAKIIVMRKRIEESTWGMYRMLFEDAYPYSYNHQELTNYISAHEQLVDAWHSAFADRIMSVQYADLVTNTQEVTQRICNFINATWSPTMLSPENNQAASLTASSTQVRQPITKDHINKGKAFVKMMRARSEPCAAI